MISGEIISRGHDLYVVLAVKGTSCVLAPLVLARRNRVAHAVPVRAGALGDGYALCAAARLVENGGGHFSGYCLTLRDLEACQAAARRAQADKLVAQRYAPLSAFEQAMPRMPRNGGRRVGHRLAL